MSEIIGVNVSVKVNNANFQVLERRKFEATASNCLLVIVLIRKANCYFNDSSLSNVAKSIRKPFFAQMNLNCKCWNKKN